MAVVTKVKVGRIISSPGCKSNSNADISNAWVHEVVSNALRHTGVGIFAGIVLSLAVARLAARLLYGISPKDPLTFVAVGTVLLSVAAVACYVPARRATRVDPLTALRHS